MALVSVVLLLPFYFVSISLLLTDLLIRSHEVKDEGYVVEHNGKCITIFSSPNYCDQVGNKGAYISFDKTLTPKFTSFTHVPHPAVKPMAYASNFGFMGL